MFMRQPHVLHKRTRLTILRNGLRARIAAIIVAGGLVVFAGGCSSEDRDAEPTVEPTTTTVEVTGTADEVPTLTYDKPFVFAEPDSSVVWEGSGEPAVEGDWVLLRMYAEDPATGQSVRNDFEAVPMAYQLTQDELGTGLFNQLEGKPFGTRVLQIAQRDTETQVVVIDLLPARSVGDANVQETTLPTVEYARDGEPSIKISKDLKEPATTEIAQLKSGGVQQVEKGAQVVIQFVAQRWDTGEVIDTTWAKDAGPVTVQVGADQIIRGLDEAIIGSPVGSQIMAVIPPEAGFGQAESELSETTLVYVVDILSASVNRE